MLFIGLVIVTTLCPESDKPVIATFTEAEKKVDLPKCIPNLKVSKIQSQLFFTCDVKGHGVGGEWPRGTPKLHPITEW